MVQCYLLSMVKVSWVMYICMYGVRGIFEYNELNRKYVRIQGAIEHMTFNGVGEGVNHFRPCVCLSGLLLPPSLYSCNSSFR